MNKCTCQKPETRFFSRRCEEANAILAGLELNLHRHKFSQKRLNCALSYDFEIIFKGMSPASDNVWLVGVYKKNESATAIHARTALKGG